MTRFIAACLLTAAAAVFGAPAAVADPADLVPYCSGDQTPMDNNCREMPDQMFTNGDGAGANPDVPLGTNPGVQPAT